MTLLKFKPVFLALLLTVPMGGCIESQSVSQAVPFERNELDACLAIVIDMSGSFAESWDDRAYHLFLDLSEQYFTEAMGTENRLVISQLSGNERVVLFDGRPSDLQRKFSSPETLDAFLKAHSDPRRSRVYDAMTKTIDYVSSMSGVSDRTRMMTVVLSDMGDSESEDAARIASGRRMIESLTKYQQRGGGLALYFVATEENTRWEQIMAASGFQPGHFIIENELNSTPQLPRFD